MSGIPRTQTGGRAVTANRKEIPYTPRPKPAAPPSVGGCTFCERTTPQAYAACPCMGLCAPDPRVQG